MNVSAWQLKTDGLVIIRMKTECPIGHEVFILMITKPEVSLTILKTLYMNWYACSFW